jgi:hypothetical protein
MERLTDKSQVEILRAKKDLTETEKIYLKLALYENEKEAKNLFDKAQLQKAISKAIGMFSDMVKVAITEEVLSAMFYAVKGKAVDGKIEVSEVEKIALEVIQIVKSGEVKSSN